jgi:hypothetical protein
VAEPKYTVSIMTCVRGESACVTEWLLYHQTIGFDHVYLYCNDEDPTDLYTQVLPFCRGEAPFVTFHHFPFPGQQFYMMMHALRHHKDASHWVAFLDVDEFLVLHGFDGIQDYLRRCPANWDSINFNRSVFGHSGYIERPPGGVLSRYTRREDRLHAGGKTVTRSAKIDLSRITGTLYFWHGWGGVFGPGFLAVNAAGVPMAEVAGSDEGAAYVQSAEHEGRIRRIGYINHYAFKSVREFEQRAQRGMLGESPTRSTTQSIWRQVSDVPGTEATLQALNAIEDRYLADFWRHKLHLDRTQQIVPVPQLPNIALGKPADQSSISEWSRGTTTADDAAGVINGLITGGAQCHTSLETDPWWMVDLGGPHLIYEIRIFNRVDHPAVRDRLGGFRLERADSDGVWAPIYTHDASRSVGGADGAPLILTLGSPSVAVRLRLVALGQTYLHLDQVEIYGVPVSDTVPRDAAGNRRAGPDVSAPAEDAVGAGQARALGGGRADDDAPVVHVDGRGGMANRMIQYMAAHAIAANVPGCRISGVDLPDWGIHHPEIPRGAGIREACASGPEMRIGRAGLIASLVSRRVNRVRLDSLAQHLDNFAARGVCADLFPAVATVVPEFGAEHLVIQLAEDAPVQAGDPDHTLLPVEFIQEIVAQSGLRPVFIGVIGDGPYVGRLRALFPVAVFLPRQAPLHDFETIRRAPNILLAVSTFGWLAAWLSQAQRIYLPMTGFLNPAQFPEIDLLPLDDPRYRFYLFPANYGVPEAEVAAAHASLRGQWRLMTPAMISELRARRPRFGSPLELFQAHFDEEFYLWQNEAVRDAVAAGRLQSGFEHYRDYGYFARLAPFRLDRAWYGREYKLAAIEVGQGDFADFHHHYLAIGRARGYRPFSAA